MKSFDKSQKDFDEFHLHMLNRIEKVFKKAQQKHCLTGESYLDKKTKLRLCCVNGVAIK